MAVKIFMQVATIKGESQDSEHKEWIDIVNIDHTVSQIVTTEELASTKGSGTPEFSQITVRKAVDISTPDLYMACAKGNRIDQIVIKICKASNSKEVMATFTLKNCLFTKVSFLGSSGSGGDPMEEVSFGFSHINYKVKKGDRTWNVAEQKPE